MEYRIEFAYPTLLHLKRFSAREQAIVIAAIEEKLVHEPKKETRNRKKMRPNPIASCELRVGETRVYYDPFDEPEAWVLVVAIGVKIRNQVKIGDEVIEL